MALLTTLEQLESVQAAIAKSEAAIELGQGDKRLVRERLHTLYAREKYLLSRRAAETGAAALRAYAKNKKRASL